MEPSSRDHELMRRVEDAFDLFLQSTGNGRLPEMEAFVAGQPVDLREKLRALIEQYLRIREKFGEGPRGFRAGRELGHYRLVREIGRGAMGIVFEAHDEMLDRAVAIKLLYPIYSLSMSVLERFQREASAGGRLNHPGIVGVMEVGEDQDTHYIVQELVRGGSMDAMLAELRLRDGLPSGHFRDVARTFAEVAEALAVAHAQGVVHRDLKPANILLTREGRPKVADFGLAWIEEEVSHSGTGTSTGTPFYMSPEQVDSRRGRIGPHTDVFSLGVSLYEALTLTRPFQGDTRQQVAQSILHLDPLDPSRVRSRVPRDLAVICLAAMEKAPADRYRDAGAMARDLRRFLNHEPIHARPPSGLHVALKWCRRHKAIASSGAVLVLSLIVVTGLLVKLRIALAKSDMILKETEPLLRALDPDQSADPRTLLELLEFADENLGDRPDIQAAWRSAIGQRLSFLGLHREAVAALEAAWEHLASDPAVRARDRLAVGRALARSYQQLERSGEAEALLRSLLARLPAGGDDRDRRELLAALLSILVHRGSAQDLRSFADEYLDPERLLERLLDERERRDGEQSPAALEALLTMAHYRRAVGDLQGAKHALERTQGRFSAGLSPVHPLLLEQIDLLGSLRAELGDHDGGAKLLRRLAAFSRTGGVHYEPHARGALQRRLGLIELEIGYYPAAIELFLESIERSAPGERRAEARRRYASTLVERALWDAQAAVDLPEARAALQSALDEDLPPTHGGGTERAQLLTELAFVELLAEDWQRAAQVLEACLAAGAGSLAAADRADPRELLARALVGLGRTAEAIEHQRSTWEALRAERGDWDPRGLAALRRLVTMLHEAESKGEALERIDGWRRASRKDRPAGEVADVWDGILDGWQALAEEEPGEAIEIWRRIPLRPVAFQWGGPSEQVQLRIALGAGIGIHGPQSREAAELSRAHAHLVEVARTLRVQRTTDRYEAAMLQQEIAGRLARIRGR